MHDIHYSLRKRIHDDIVRNRRRIRELGPGVITGGAGDDPAGIVTYTLVGASTGFSLLWLMLLSTPMMIAVQSTTARIAIVTGKSLPELTNAFYSRKLTTLMILVLATANILTIGADLQALAAILGIITGWPAIYFLVPITALIAYMVMYYSYRTIKHILIGLTLVLMVYIINVFLAHPDWLDSLTNTLVPHIEMQWAWIIAALALLGTTISPYLLFWQAAEEGEEKKTVVQAESVAVDTIIGMSYSNLLANCMIISGAVMLYGQSDGIQTMEALPLALQPVSPQYAFALFSIGVIVSGLLAIPVLAGSTAYGVADAFGWREGMDHKVSDARGFYLVFLGAMLFGNLVDMSPLSAVDALYYSQVLNGMLLPVLIGIVLTLANNRQIMGRYVNGRFNNILSLLTLLLTTALTLVLAWQWLVS